MERPKGLAALAGYVALVGGALLWGFNATTSSRSQQPAGLHKPLTAASRIQDKKPPKPVAKTSAEDSLAIAAAPPVAPVVDVPTDQEISINLICDGVAEGSNKVDFDFRVLWGELKHARTTLELASNQSAASKLDLGIAQMRVSPVFLGGQKCKYAVQVYSPGGALMGQFSIAEASKQVKLMDASTPGFRQQIVFFDRERQLTAYRIQRINNGNVSAALGLLFVGQGWTSVEASKAPVNEEQYSFPKVDMVVLPKAWMDLNDIDMTMRTLKRGQESVAGVCYS